MSPEARRTDDGDHYEEFKRQRRYERGRTVFLSMFCSGITALALLYPIEVQNTKNDRSNCIISNAIPVLLTEQSNQQADGVLGRPARPGIPAIKPFDFSGTTLKDFKPLIVAQARTNRNRAVQYAKTVRNCNKAFPYPKFFGVDVVPGD